MAAARICIAVAFLQLVVSPLGFGQAFYGGIDTIKINACCNQTEETDEIKRELQEIKELLNTVLANSACCCNQPTPPTPSTTTTTEIIPTTPRDCYDLQQSGSTTSGVYTIQPDESSPIQVFCDMETDQGGWTVFQRRMDGSVDFFRDWADYEDGFGSLTGEHWLGLKNLFYLTNQQPNQLRIDLADFERDYRYAEYGSFSIDKENSYRLTVGDYSGDAGDAMRDHDGQYFSTRDLDNDGYYDGSCADLFKGAWWYDSCHTANLNGLYLAGEHESYADGIEWYQWRGYNYSLRITEMKLRPIF